MEHIFPYENVKVKYWNILQTYVKTYYVTTLHIFILDFLNKPFNSPIVRNLYGSVHICNLLLDIY